MQTAKIFFYSGCNLFFYHVFLSMIESAETNNCNSRMFFHLQGEW